MTFFEQTEFFSQKRPLGRKVINFDTLCTEWQMWQMTLGHLPQFGIDIQNFIGLLQMWQHFIKMLGFCVNLGAAKHFVIQSVSEESREHKVDATDILPPFGLLNDTKEDFTENSNEYCP